MQDLSFEGPVGERLCRDILQRDNTVIFASISSFSGSEIAAASKPSATLLIGDGEKLREKYSSLVSLMVDSFRQGEYLFGKLTRIVAAFEKNLRVVIIPIFSKEICVVLITTRESEARTIAFQISKLVERFE